jgi:hypothetical protein
MADTPEHRRPMPTLMRMRCGPSERGWSGRARQSKETGHMVTPYRAKLAHPDQQEEPPKGSKWRFHKRPSRNSLLRVFSIVERKQEPYLTCVRLLACVIRILLSGLDRSPAPGSALARE